jgi:hypothetical protein
MIANPQATLKEAAPVFKKHPQYLYMLTNTDMFKERLAQRRADIAADLREQILERTGRVAVKGLKEIERRLDSQDTAKVSLKTITEVTETALKALGYGEKAQPAVVVNNIVETGASPSAVREAAAAMRQTQFDQARESAVVGQEVRVTEPAPPVPVHDESLLALDSMLFDDEAVTLVREDA